MALEAKEIPTRGEAAEEAEEATGATLGDAGASLFDIFVVWLCVSIVLMVAAGCCCWLVATLRAAADERPLREREGEERRGLTVGDDCADADECC